VALCGRPQSMQLISRTVELRSRSTRAGASMSVWSLRRPGWPDYQDWKGSGGRTDALPDICDRAILGGRSPLVVATCLS